MTPSRTRAPTKSATSSCVTSSCQRRPCSPAVQRHGCQAGLKRCPHTPPPPVARLSFWRLPVPTSRPPNDCPRRKGQCFKCDELYTPSLRDVCKQLLIIVVVCESEETTPPDPYMVPEPTISLHDLTGIQPWTGRTMQLHIVIHDARLTTLLDSGSVTPTFYKNKILCK
jgi:hypothetical protein